jgi:hypothetical protein
MMMRHFCVSTLLLALAFSQTASAIPASAHSAAAAPHSSLNSVPQAALQSAADSRKFVGRPGTNELPLEIPPDETTSTPERAVKSEELQLQWKTYLWTTAIGIATLVILVAQALVFLWQGLQLRLTIAETKKATQATQMSAKAASRSVDIASQALVASNRPWVKADVRMCGPINYNVNGANFHMEFSVENVGRSPATNVNIRLKVVSSFSEDKPWNPTKEFENYIGEIKQAPPMPFGFTVFPSEQRLQRVSTSMTNEQIADATKRINAIYPKVIGAIAYKTGFDDDVHLTGFSFNVQTINTPFLEAQKRSNMAIWPDHGDVPGHEIVLVHNIAGSSYAD